MNISVSGRIAAGLLVAVGSTGAVSAAPAPVAPNPAGAGAADTSQNTGDRRLNELFYQLQVLQQEVQELRGLIEEQSYQLNRLARDQQEQYIDLDRRVAGLSTSGAPSPRTPSVSTSSPPTATGAAGTGSGVSTGAPPPLTMPNIGVAPRAGASGPETTTVAEPAPSPRTGAGLSERDAYTAAFDLMKARKFNESITGFNELIVAYPNGQYTPNAYYWLGELYLAQQNAEQARQSFLQVINLYPDHPKVPDTLYKLGVTYHRLGDSGTARQYFTRVRSEYPASSAAGLATSYAAELQ